MKKTKHIYSILAGSFVLLLASLACARRTAYVPTPSAITPPASAVPAVTIPAPATLVPTVPAPVGSTRLPAGEATRTLVHDGLTRSYILYVPSAVDWSRPVPLVIVLHGGTGNAESAVRMSGFNAVADRYGFLVAYPNGTGLLSDNALLTWNGGTCCGYSVRENVDDVGFMRAIVGDLQAQADIDLHRIYATGMSNGAILAQRLACQAADLFAAIAPVSGTLNFSPCTPSRPIALIEFHGSADQNIQYNGGFGPKSISRVDFASVPATINFWTAFDQCSPQPHTNSFADIRHDTWTGCAASSSVELYTVIGGGHAWPGSNAGGWPGSDAPTQTISASQIMWDFFAAHPKP